jgi:hypothetical protein
MGRKGVSKRKISKSKDAPVMSKSPNGAVSALAHGSESAAPPSPGRGESNSAGKGGKKK